MQHMKDGAVTRGKMQAPWGRKFRAAIYAALQTGKSEDMGERVHNFRRLAKKSGFFDIDYPECLDYSLVIQFGQMEDKYAPAP
ncbi:MAG: hypothetical protein Fur0016_12280 [Anaerolineales bacterium]